MSVRSYPMRVFLCHSSGDKPVLRELYQKLDAESWMDVWLDEEKLLPGQDWDYEIEKALDRSDAVIVALSTKSVSKEGYVQRELRFVLDMALEKPEGMIFILPVRLDDCERPRRLRPIQGVDYFPLERREWAYARLRQSLEVRANELGIETAGPAPIAEKQWQLNVQNETAENGKVSGSNPVVPLLIEKLIQRGENARVEFKSSLRWNIKGNHIDKIVEHSVLKTIVAFLNTEGGMMLIGVADNGNVLGIEVDQFPSDDKFLLHFANSINDKIGKHYTDQIHWELKQVSGKTILRVECSPSSTPVFLKMGGKEEFFIRNGPSNVSLSTSEVLEYSRKHFR